VSTPLGEDVLLFHRMLAKERLGGLFEYELDLLSENAAIDPDKLLGENVTVGVSLPEGEWRYFNGYVAQVRPARYEKIPYHPETGGTDKTRADHIHAWTVGREVQPGAHALTDYDFDMQTLQLIVVQRGLVAARAGVGRIELGTWDIAAARAANANILNPPP